jgi:DNA-binding protein H-NS
MTDDQDALKTEYGRLLKERAVFQKIVNTEMARWDGQGQKPAALAEAESSRDALDIELARVADKVRF